jgi:hypothetical protein
VTTTAGNTVTVDSGGVGAFSYIFVAALNHFYQFWLAGLASTSGSKHVAQRRFLSADLPAAL